MSRIAVVAITLVWLCGAQERREFDVASVKLSSRDAGPGYSISRTPGTLTARKTTLTRLVEMAYQTNQIDWSRVPDSLRSTRYEIVAKSAGKISGDEYWEMLRALLEDRFQLRHHTETRNARLYFLIPAKKGAGLGPRINASADPSCPVNPSGSNFCGVNYSGPGMMVGQRVPMSRIARELSNVAGRAVQDRTGLAGAFDFQLRWTPDQEAAGATLDSGPSFFPAVKEELGLQLESGQGPVEILVIDRAESPSEN